jgi:tRNA (guanine37-N1)-methyltransferase
VLSIWNDPFPAYAGPPLSSRERSKRARDAQKAKKAAVAEVEAAPGPDTDVVQQLAATTLDAPSTAAESTTLSTPSTHAPKPRRLPSHYIMNLPASALSFLDAFQGLFRELYATVEGGEEEVLRIVKEEVGGLPTVHCYCFTKEEEGEPAIRDICEVRLFLFLLPPFLSILVPSPSPARRLTTTLPTARDELPRSHRPPTARPLQLPLRP